MEILELKNVVTDAKIHWIGSTNITDDRREVKLKTEQQKSSILKSRRKKRFKKCTGPQ